MVKVSTKNHIKNFSSLAPLELSASREKLINIMTILRAEYVELLQRIASGASTKSLIQSIREKGVEPDEVPKLLNMIKVTCPSQKYKLIASVILKEGLKGDISELPVIAELAPRTLPVFRMLADYMTRTMQLDESMHIRDMVSSNYKKRVWDRSLAEFLSKYRMNRFCHKSFYQKLKFQKPEELSELELLQRSYANIAKLASEMSSHDLASAALDLHKKGHLDVIVEMMRLECTDASIEHLVQGAEIPESAVDPGHWIWVRVMLQRLKEGNKLPNMNKFILANVLKGNMDDAKMMFQVQESSSDKRESSEWMGQIFKSWKQGF